MCLETKMFLATERKSTMDAGEHVALVTVTADFFLEGYVVTFLAHSLLKQRVFLEDLRLCL